jgi:16S rRNA (cytosine1402-N4)-methyltransferase
MSMKHDPVMLREILEVLDPKPGHTIVDGTLGLAGHSLRFAEAIRPDGTLVGMDWDEAMLAEARRRLGDDLGISLHLVRDDFRNMKAALDERGLRPNGILLDLGLNSAQVDDPQRGISFREEGPLDMRMDRTKGEPASALLNRLSPTEIETILWELGDERWAKAIAKKIVERRKTHPLRTTNDLVEAVLAAVPVGARDKRINPATRTFQAVRIAVNGELEGLAEALQDAARSLAPEGALAVLSYHSGEDRIVKQTFRELVAEEEFSDLFKKPVQPGAEEVTRNPRSRSAKLRALRKTGS